MSIYPSASENAFIVILIPIQNLNLQDNYIDALINELNTINQNKFKTIFVGGGTPTILSLKNIEKLLKALNKFTAPEYTFECNPGTLHRINYRMMKDYGVNRLSIGLQAWQDDLLKSLGRIHNLKDFFNNYDECKKTWILKYKYRFNVWDSNQTIEDWDNTINEVIKLKPRTYFML